MVYRIATGSYLHSVVSLLAISARESRSLSTALMVSSPYAWNDKKLEALAKCFLPLSPDNHKGSSGRIGVLGGSAQYTGAPYYAGMAALHSGADLAFIFCAQEAALAIKSYSPELMVAPVYAALSLDSARNEGTENEQCALVDGMVEKVVSYMDRLHVLVMGPGLGRCPLVFQATAQIMKQAMARNLWIVVDADALFLLTLDDYKGILADYDKVVLTPNVMEYKRLIQAFGGEDMGLFTKGLIVQKGAQDLITQGGALEPLICAEIGGLKRSGGLGDILSGTLATFIGWHMILQSRGCDVDQQLSCWAACCVTKRATHSAFQFKRRAMTAPDVLNFIGPTMMEMEAIDS